VERRHRTAQGHERRQQLLDAAAALFASRGFAATRVADVAEAAGVAKGLFYWYFDTKDALFQELVDSTRQRMRAAQAAAIDPHATPLLKLRQGCAATARFIATHPDVFTAFRSESAGEPTAGFIRAGGEVHLQDTTRLVEAGIRAGQVHEEDARQLAVGIVGVVTSYGRARRSGRLRIEVDELAEVVGRTIVRALAIDDGVRAAIEEAAADARRAAPAHADAHGAVGGLH
jgi:AcrR family transcriptional regulator